MKCTLRTWEKKKTREGCRGITVKVVDAAVQTNNSDFPWLRCHTSNAGGAGSVPGRGTNIPQAVWPPNPPHQIKQMKKKNKQTTSGAGGKSIIIPVFQMRQGSGKSLPRSHRVGLSAGNLIPELSSVPEHCVAKPTHKHKITWNVFSLLPSGRSVAAEG